MIFQDDNTFQNVKEKSVLKWLEDLKNHEDVTIRGGSVVTQEYILQLKDQIEKLEQKCALKDSYLKKCRKNR